MEAVQSSKKTSHILSSVKSFIEETSKKHSLSEAYLFGSWAYGSPKEDSDIDIAIILDEDVSFDLESNIYSDAQDVNVKFETHVFSKDVFRKARRQIVKEIKTKGIRIA